MKVAIETGYSVYIETEINLPESKTMSDIKNVWVKWGKITIEFKDSSTIEHSENETGPDNDIWKRPGSIKMLNYNDNSEKEF